MIKGVLALSPSSLFGGPKGGQKHQKTMQKKRAEMEAQSQKIRGLNLNPLAPAQSKRTFAFYGKTLNSIEFLSISAPFFFPFLYHFRAFSRNVEKEVQGRTPESYKYTKMDPRGAQTEPKNQQIEPQGAAKSEKPTKLPSKGGTMEPQVLQWSPKTPQSTRKTQKKSPKCEQSMNMCRKCRKTHKHT